MFNRAAEKYCVEASVIKKNNQTSVCDVVESLEESYNTNISVVVVAANHLVVELITL